jgi:hypothetical protein
MQMPTAAILLASSYLPIALCLDVNGSTKFQSSTKRGLIYIPSSEHPSDAQVWVENGTDLTWYYNYDSTPSDAYSNRSQADLEFVPMLWGSSNSSDFASNVESLIKNEGRNITQILTFNEPDGSSSTGGSDIAPETAATIWINDIAPLRKLNVKLGAPAVTGSQGGFIWLSEFFGNCSSQNTNCTVDFIPIHWYGDFQGLASHIGQVVAT